MATGNTSSPTASMPNQNSGFFIMLERTNYWRYISYLRSIHRGQYFLETKLLTVRKLKPESWGFLCPLHTPDGPQCGLLCHLTINTEILIQKDENISKMYINN